MGKSKIGPAAGKQIGRSNYYNYNNIFKILIDKRMTQRELSELSGVSTSCLTRMKNGKPVSIEALTRIADVLQCPVSDLFVKVQNEILYEERTNCTANAIYPRNDPQRNTIRL